MPLSLLQRAERLLGDRLGSAASEEVDVVVPGGESIERVTMTKVPRVTSPYQEEGLAASEVEQDWIVYEHNLVFPVSGKLAPQPGWEFRRQPVDGKRDVYVVLPNDSGRCYEVLGSLGMLLRVRTKLAAKGDA